MGDPRPDTDGVPNDYVVARAQLARLLAAITPDHQAAYCLDAVGTVAEVDAAIAKLTAVFARESEPVDACADMAANAEEMSRG